MVLQSLNIRLGIQMGTRIGRRLNGSIRAHTGSKFLGKIFNYLSVAVLTIFQVSASYRQVLGARPSWRIAGGVAFLGILGCLLFLKELLTMAVEFMSAMRQVLISKILNMRQPLLIEVDELSFLRFSVGFHGVQCFDSFNIQKQAALA